MYHVRHSPLVRKPEATNLFYILIKCVMRIYGFLFTLGNQYFDAFYKYVISNGNFIEYHENVLVIYA